VRHGKAKAATKSLPEVGELAMADLEPFPELIEGRRLDPKSWTETAPAS
jgi:hypothetical protein